MLGLKWSDFSIAFASCASVAELSSITNSEQGEAKVGTVEQ
jgi:hypothetical protein